MATKKLYFAKTKIQFSKFTTVFLKLLSCHKIFSWLHVNDMFVIVVDRNKFQTQKARHPTAIYNIKMWQPKNCILPKQKFSFQNLQLCFSNFYLKRLIMALSLAKKILFTTGYAIIFVVNLAGNLFGCAIVLKTNNCKTFPPF